MSSQAISMPPDQIIEYLKRSPRLPQVTQQLQAILRAEQEKRERFYEEVTEELRQRLS